MQTLQTSGEPTTTINDPINKRMSKKDLSIHKCLPLFLKAVLLSIAIISILALASCDSEGGNGSNGDGDGSSTPKTLTITYVDAVNDNSGTDDPDTVINESLYQLNGAASVTTAVIGTTTYLFVAGLNDDGVSVFKVDNQGKLTHVASVDDANTPPDGTGSYELDGAYSVTTAVIGTTTYLFVAGADDNGVSVFKVGNDGKLTHVHSVDDEGTPPTGTGFYELDGAISLTTAEIGTTTYLFVAGASDYGVSVFKVDNDGKLSHVASVDDNDNTDDKGTTVDESLYQLNRPVSVTTAVIGTTTYLFVAGRNDDGVSVFKVDNEGKLSHVASVDDNDNTDDKGTTVDESLYQLDGAFSVNTAELAGKTYLFVTGEINNGITVFSVANNGDLSYVSSVGDGVVPGNYRIGAPKYATTAVIGNNLYFFVIDGSKNGVTVFSVANNGALSPVAGVYDNGGVDDPYTKVDERLYQLGETYSVTTAKIGSNTYLFVAGHSDDGVSVFKVNLE